MGYVKTAKRYYSSGKRKYQRAKVWANTPQTPKQLAMQAYRGVKYLKGIINSEKMYFDRAITLGAAKADIFSLVQIAQGDQVGQRTGNSLLIKSIYLRGFMQVNSSVTVNTRVSVILVKDLQQISDTTPSVTDIFTSNDPEATIRTGQSTNTAGRFKILYRKEFNLIPNQRPTINLVKYFKLHDHVKYNGTSSTDVQKNGYYLVFLTSEVTNFPTISINSRLCYYDN